jgi:hypothetical protein
MPDCPSIQITATPTRRVLGIVIDVYGFVPIYFKHWTHIMNTLHEDIRTEASVALGEVTEESRADSMIHHKLLSLDV